MRVPLKILCKKYLQLRVIRLLRQTMASFMVFSLLWQNCLWAVVDFSIYETDSHGAQVRLNKHQKQEDIESGVISGSPKPDLLNPPHLILKAVG